jgi:hypothetical protein
MSTDADGLGPLPEAYWLWAGNGPRPYEDAYSADQMRDYRAEGVAAERERCAKLCEDVREVAVHSCRDGHARAGAIAMASTCTKLIRG